MKDSKSELSEKVKPSDTEAAHSKEQLQQVLDASTQVSIIATNSEGLITVFNRGAERMFGYTPDEVMGKQTPYIFHVESEVIARAKDLSEELGRPMHGFDVFVYRARRGEHEEREWTLVRKDGSRFPVNLIITASHDADGKVVGFLGIVTDITERKKGEEILRQSEERFRQILDAIKDYALVMLDPKGYVVSWNIGAERIKGYLSNEIIGQHFSKFYLPEDIEKGRPSKGLRIAEKEGRYAEEGWCIRKDGSRFLADVVITAIHDTTGTLRGFAQVARDITEDKSVEKALRDQAFMLDLANDTIFIRDAEDRIIYWNHGAQRLYGWSKEEALGQVTHNLLKTEFPKPLSEITAQLLASGHWKGELIHTQASGSKVTVASSWTLQHADLNHPTSVIELNHDITARKKAEQAVQAALVEKDVLLREIHHRVKNNMQVISSLLQLQKSYLHDEMDVKIFENCQFRIRSMALVHERLYRSASLASINFAEYLDDLSELIFQGHSKSQTPIRIVKECDPVDLEIDTAIPLGLIANEIISNAFKHAFSGRLNGIITLSLKKRADAISFCVLDNGVGFPFEGKAPKGKSLGMRLIESLARQIRAQVVFDNPVSGGSRLELILPMTEKTG